MRSSVVFVLASAITVDALAQQQPVRCSGIVRYSSGKPAAGVHVSFDSGVYYGNDDYNFHEAITDEHGKYEILQPKMATFHFGFVYTTNCILARDLENNLAAVQSFPIEASNVDLTLKPAIALSGSVQDTGGAPVSGAEIELDFEAMGSFPAIHPPFKADASGRFHIPAMPQGIKYLFSISAKGYGSTRGRVEAKDTKTNRYEFPKVALKHADRTLAGQVVDNEGKPLVGTRVSFGGPGQPQNSNTNTDSEGRFAFDEVCEGPLKIFAHYQDPSDTSIWMSLDGGAGMKAEGGDTNILIQLRDTSISAWDVPTLVTKGTASRPDGKPDPGVLFAVWRSANPFLNFYSDLNGNYKVRWQRPLGVIDPSNSVLVGRDLQRNLAFAREIDETSTNLDVRMEPGLEIAGHLLDENDAVVTNVQVSLDMELESASAELTRTVTDDHGSFSFAGLPQEGTYTLELLTKFSEAGPRRVIVSGGETNLVLKLPLTNYNFFGQQVQSSR